MSEGTNNTSTFTQAVEEAEINEKLEIAEKKLSGICTECYNPIETHKMSCSQNELNRLHAELVPGSGIFGIRKGTDTTTIKRKRN